MNFAYILSIALLVFGFGFVIFWHELGHFLAAKWVGIRVEQFAVGFGHAILSWRKGIGLRVGNTQREYERRLKEYVETEEGHLDRRDRSAPTQEQLNRAAEKLGLGETEYRLNWIPLGGYVKMLGQDDLNPNAQSEDPRAFNRKSIPARMLVVSAGVIMNIILAAIGFMIVFRIGFRVAPAEVGGVVPGSPAQVAGLQVGDKVWTYDGKRQYDWTKIQLNVALSGDGEAVPMEVKRVVNGQGALVPLTITPHRERDSMGLLSLGITPPKSLEGVSEKEKPVDDLDKLAEIVPAGYLALQPGDVITAVNGQPVSPHDYPKFDAVLQSSYGAPVHLTVTNTTGATRSVTVQPKFAEPSFDPQGFNLLGMVPRAEIGQVLPNSPARGRLKPGDAIVAITIGGDTSPSPSRAVLMERLNKAGQNGRKVDLQVLRDGKVETIAGLSPEVKVDADRRGLGVGLDYDERHAVVADVVAGSEAASAGIGNGAQITAVNGNAVQSWHDVHKHLAGAAPDRPVTVAYKTRSGEEKQATLPLGQQQFADVRSVRYTHELFLGEPREIRKTDNLLTAAGWGVTETRDFILQFYLTLRRMFDGSVSPKNLMGPIGIFHAGTKFAYKGHDWLIWFLAMISANLAVVNFLPIPIVDGGLFTFLILEKIKGRPLSARTQTIAQFVGMAVLLCVFLLVTYQDIARLTFMR